MNTPMRKILGDIAATPSRFAMMIISIALSSAVLIAMLLAYTLLTREMQRNYLDTQPAAAELVFDSADALQQMENISSIARQNPAITGAEMGGKYYFRVEVAPNEFVTALIFIVPDASNTQISKTSLQAGQWPKENEIILERKSLKVAKLAVSDQLTLIDAQGKSHNLKISGVVHDPALAPADTEHMLYGYMSYKHFIALGEHLSNSYLKIAVARQFTTSAKITKIATDLIKNIPLNVSEIHVPPPAQHPHQTQMMTGLNMLLLFSFLAVLLGAILMATTLWGMLAQQVRQIGVMKTLGATSVQINKLYLLLVGGIGLAAICLGLPLGIMGGNSLTNMVADLLNLEIQNRSTSFSLWLFVLIFCIGTPVFLAYFPIRAATKKSVRAALDDYENGKSITKNHIKRSWIFLSPLWAMVLRNLTRKPSRTGFSLLLLAIAGATFLSSQNLLSSWNHLSVTAHEHRHYQIELSFPETASIETIKSILTANSNVAGEEFIQRASAAVTSVDDVIVKQVYPDGGHGSLSLFSLSENTKSMSIDLKSGHWFKTEDEIVVNQSAYHSFFTDKKIGDTVFINTAGMNRKFVLAGIINEPLTGASLYTKKTNETKLNSARITLKDVSPIAIDATATQLQKSFEQADIALGKLNTENFRQQSGNGHLMLMVSTLVMISIAMILAGFFSLATVMSANVSERLREFAVMRTLGAKNAAVMSLVINEALLISLCSLLLALPLAATFSTLMVRSLGKMSAQPLSLIFSLHGLAMWLGILLVGAIAASLAPALYAKRFSLRQALSFS